MAQAFDSASLRISGEAVPVAPRLGTVQGGNISYRRRNFTASANGLLIYDPHTDRQRSQMLWVDRNGKPLHMLAQLDNVSVPFLSPDESRIVVARKDLASNNNDLWLRMCSATTRFVSPLIRAATSWACGRPTASALSGRRRATGASICMRRR